VLASEPALTRWQRRDFSIYMPGINRIARRLVMILTDAPAPFTDGLSYKINDLTWYYVGQHSPRFQNHEDLNPPLKIKVIFTAQNILL
jgi:hypothetical protein